MNDLAGWIDGARDEDVEAILADSADARSAVELARAVLADESLTYVSPAVLDRAIRLVPAPVRPMIQTFWLTRVAGVAAAILVCILGYRVGMDAPLTAPNLTPEAIQSLSLGAFDTQSTVNFDLDLLAGEEI